MSPQIEQAWHEKAKYGFVKLLLDHQKTIDMCLDVSSSIHNFALSKSPLSFLEGGVRVVRGFAGNLNSYSTQYFNATNGWKKIVCPSTQKPLYCIFEPIVKIFPFKKLTFRNETRQDIGIYNTPCGDIGFDAHGFWLVPSVEHTEEAAMQFFIDEKMKSIKSKFFSICSERENDSDNYYATYKFDLKDEEISKIDSETSEALLAYIKSFLDKDIKRSFLFVGVPGTGKTTIAQTVIDNLGFKTLKFKYDSKNTNLSVIQFFVRALDIEAIILDDFDQTSDTPSLLEFLEWIHNNTKLVLLVSNSIKKFHCALLRPGRVDKIIDVDHLDEAVVRAIFGTTHPELVQITKLWPIAFINELSLRLKANPNVDMAPDLEELKKRIADQLASLK